MLPSANKTYKDRTETPPSRTRWCHTTGWLSHIGSKKRSHTCTANIPSFVLCSGLYRKRGFLTLLYSINHEQCLIPSRTSHLERLDRSFKSAKCVLRCTKAAKRLGPLRCELHAPLRVFQGLALGISKFEVGRAAIAEVYLWIDRNLSTREKQRNTYTV